MRSTKIAAALRADKYADSRVAAELRDQLELFVAYPAARELPQAAGLIETMCAVSGSGLRTA